MRDSGIPDEVFLRALLDEQEQRRQHLLDAGLFPAANSYYKNHLPPAHSVNVGARVRCELLDVDEGALHVKAHQLIHAHLMLGCTCRNCDGDYEITEAGLQLLRRVQPSD